MLFSGCKRNNYKTDSDLGIEIEEFNNRYNKIASYLSQVISDDIFNYDYISKININNKTTSVCPNKNGTLCFDKDDLKDGKISSVMIFTQKDNDMRYFLGEVYATAYAINPIYSEVTSIEDITEVQNDVNSTLENDKTIIKGIECKLTEFDDNIRFTFTITE